SGAVNGTKLTGLLKFKGGSGDDTLTIGPSGKGYQFSGAGGNNTIVGPDVNMKWSVRQANAGEIFRETFTGGAVGYDKVLEFFQAANLQGGSGDDTFDFRPVAGVDPTPYGSISGTVKGGDGS